MTNDSLEVRWLEGDEAAAGLLTAGMTAAELRAFATEALAVCCGKVDVPPAVFDVAKVGRDDPSRGHAAFDAVRQLELRSGMQRQSAASQLLCVAEHVARVIYNSTAPDDPFDADADEYMFKSMAAFCMSLKPDTRGVLSQELCRVLTSIRRSGISTAEMEAIRASKLATRWFVGDPEACKTLAGDLTDVQLRLFAVDALTACCEAAAVVPSSVLGMLDAGRRAPGSARLAFDTVQELRLASEASQPVTIDSRLLRVAECAARVIYNSIGPDDPFDHAAKEWLFQTTASFYYASPNDVRRKLGERLLQALPCATGNKAPRSQTS